MYPYNTDVTQFMVSQAAPVLNDPTHQNEVLTPDNKLSEGIDSVQRHMPAPWLPVVRYDNKFKAHVVISSQKVVAIANMADGTQYLVPAGYALDDLDATYTEEDVRLGIKGPDGKTPVKAGEKVKDKMTAAGVKVSNFVGIVNYNVFRHMGGDGVNPTKYNYRNFNPQPNVSYNMDYAYEYPLVKDAVEYGKAPLKGIAAFIGKDILAGQFVTYDKDSNFIVADAGKFGYGAIDPTRIIGQISKVTKFKDPDTGAPTANKFNHLDKVINPSHLGQSTEGLNSLPGYNNGGYITKMTYANAYGLISFSIQTR